MNINKKPTEHKFQMQDLYYTPKCLQPSIEGVLRCSEHNVQGLKK